MVTICYNIAVQSSYESHIGQGEMTMNFRIKQLLLGICAGLLCCLCACGTVPNPPSSVALPEADALYASALVPIRNANNLILSVTLEQQRKVGEETFTERISGTAAYSGLGTAAMDACIEQTLQFGTSEHVYTEYYTDGTAYCQNGTNTFACHMTSKEFTDRQIPAIILDPALYEVITTETTENRTLIRFSQATALESWAGNADAILVSAGGTATLDLNGNLLQSTYHAEYLLGQIPYNLHVTNKVATPAALDLSEKLPAGLSGCTVLSAPDALWTLLQATGYIRSAQAITCSYEEYLDCKAASILRIQQVQVNTHGSGSDFAARADYSGSITDYTGTPSVTTQTELFMDGRKRVSINGSAAISQPGTTIDAMRSYCENCVLSAVFPIAYLQDARWETGESTRTLHFTGTQALAHMLCASIYDGLQTGNLDSFSQSFTTNDISGYLSVDLHTGLPVKTGLSLSRTHIIGGISYELTYKLDSDITLASTTAFDAITADPLPTE